MKAAVATTQVVSDPVSRYACIGLWGLPIFAFLLGVGTITHQPPPQERLGDWSLYVTTNEFLLSHLIATIGGAIFGAFGFISFGVVFMQRGSIRLGLWGMMTGVTAMFLVTSVFGVAAFTQPAVGRFYLAGHHDLAQGLYYDAVQGTPLLVVVGIALPLMIASFVMFGVAVARSADLPKIAGIGLASSIVLFAVIGFAFDNWIQSVGSALMLLFAIWIVVALRRSQASRVVHVHASLAESEGR